MRVTKENVDVLKPGMLAKVSGKWLRFVKHGTKPNQLFFKYLKSKKYDGSIFFDLDWYDPIILIND